ncbi:MULTISPECIES: hypothetical protein [Sphingobacterium]|uniref:hypothetical protein n=1 Tax=Sphingobacterium TaxID=28453 RepID=UPI0028AAF1D5|nr:hypothetical protein [Sphingobacterium multivorum]
MKKILICITILMACFPPIVQAQNFNEWFRQKKTQKQYLLQQIAALQVYKGALKKGYKIVDDGLNIISDLKDGEFSLHKDYFNRLRRVSPFVKQYPKIASIGKCYKAIYNIREESDRLAAFSKTFTQKELEAMRATWSKVLNDCDVLITELENICSDNSLEMNDIQRVEQIDKIHSEMEANLAFSSSFSREIHSIKQGRSQAEKDIRVLRSLNGLK